MTRRRLIAGNWKLNLGPTDATTLARDLVIALRDRGDVDIVLFPTALSLAATVAATRGSDLSIGVQEIAVAPSGAFTGANSGAMAREIGAEVALVGHSERRQLYGETNEGTGLRLRAALAAGLLPMLCVGESLDQRDRGDAERVVQEQLAAAIATLSPDQMSALTIAYEPVWAIGTGRTASPAQAQAMHATIRAWLLAAFGDATASCTRILYGGSVKPGNASELLSCPDIDGALVGGASLSAESFAAIVRA